MSIPASLAAVKIVVPLGTVTSTPSIVHVTVGASVLGGTLRAMAAPQDYAREQMKSSPRVRW